MNRRDFFLRTSAAAGAIALDPFPHHLFAGTVKKYATDRIKLGPMGVPLSRLAMGTGTNGSGGSSNQTKKLGLAGVADLFRAGFDQGVTFWDSADQYGTHPHLKEALKGVAREKVTIMTKTSASTETEMKAAGKGVMGMKIFGAGKLRDKTEECLQFALALDCVDCFTIGAESRAELA